MTFTYRPFHASWIFIGICSVIVLTACQSHPVPYDGFSGYQIESQQGQNAILTYTLSANQSLQQVNKKLIRSCQAALHRPQPVQITIISQQEIAAPIRPTTQQGIHLGQSHTQFSLSQNQQLGASAVDNATLRGLETQPQLLQIIRFRCVAS